METVVQRGVAVCAPADLDVRVNFIAATVALNSLVSCIVAAIDAEAKRSPDARP